MTENNELENNFMYSCRAVMFVVRQKRGSAMNSDLVFYGGLLTDIKDRIRQAQTRLSPPMQR